MVKGACKTDALALAAREADTAFPHIRLKAIRQFRFDEVEQLRDGASFAQTRRIDLIVRQPKRDVARDRVVDKEDVLWHITDRSLPRRHQLQCKRPAIDQD